MIPYWIISNVAVVKAKSGTHEINTKKAAEKITEEIIKILIR